MDNMTYKQLDKSGLQGNDFKEYRKYAGDLLFFLQQRSNPERHGD
jgi:hypothetical protein